jgi:surface polysaccharide O-acyltransferase-like enzyme
MAASIPVRTQWVDQLRSFITLLVIAHHAALAYTDFASFNPAAYILSTHPVVDRHRWTVLDGFAAFNDTFFMPLMFLISGLFTLTALRRKGASSFLSDRFHRLFIPFLIAVTLLMGIAYYPAYLLSAKPPGIYNYLLDFFTVEAWPVGPPWFIWVLFLFNIMIIPLAPFLAKTGRHLQPMAAKRPAKVLVFCTLTALIYVPAAMFFGPFTWTGLGPFDFQKSRLLLYFGYFLAGAVIGLTDFDRDLFSRESRFVKSWPIWIAGSITAFMLQIFVFPAGTLHLLIFALTTAITSLAFLAIFKAAANGNHQFWRSLSANAYGMYLTHYIFIVWCQYALMNVDWTAGIKFLVTFIISAPACWLFTSLLKKARFIGAYI